MTHCHDAHCCWDCYASRATHAGSAERCPGLDACPRAVPLAEAPPLVRIVLAWAAIGQAVYPSTRLCLRCLRQRYLAPADEAAAEPVCRGHLAEDRINDMIKGWGL